MSFSFLNTWATSPQKSVMQPLHPAPWFLNKEIQKHQSFLYFSMVYEKEMGNVYIGQLLWSLKSNFINKSVRDRQSQRGEYVGKAWDESERRSLELDGSAAEPLYSLQICFLLLTKKFPPNKLPSSFCDHWCHLLFLRKMKAMHNLKISNTQGSKISSALCFL